jgi:lysophospholipase L1-like esterase
MGWGDPIGAYFDQAKITVINRAMGGRSSRTFLTEGRWDQVLAEMKPGDFVLMQFGHNDGIRPDDPARPRGSLRGAGDEARDIIHPHTKKPETVHTYGWYLRRYIADAKTKGATPIVLSPVPRNRWNETGKVFRASQDYGKWAAESAQAGGAHFIDLNEIVARRYESLGQDKVQTLFHGDWTHTSPAGAEINAASVVAGLKSLPGNPLGLLFSAKAADILLHSLVPAK